MLKNQTQVNELRGAPQVVRDMPDYIHDNGDVLIDKRTGEILTRKPLTLNCFENPEKK